MMGRAMAVTAALLALACNSPSAPAEDEAVPGLLRIGSSDAVHVEVPSTVTAGETFEVTVRTWGPDSCWSGERTDVAVTGLNATVRPLDRYVDPGATAGCYFAFVEIEHVADLRFEEPGSATVTVHGRTYSGELAVTHSVEVTEE